MEFWETVGFLVGRYIGNDLDCFSFPFLEIGFWISEVSCPTRNANFKSCFLDTQLKPFSFYIMHKLARNETNLFAEMAV